MGNFILRDQSDLLGSLKVRIRDTLNARWSDAEIMSALNSSLATWNGRVAIERAYNIPGGWVAGVMEYALPGYVNTRSMQVEMRRAPGDHIYAVRTDDWVPVPGWSVQPGTDGAWYIRFDVSPASTDGRVVWYSSPSSMPSVAPILSVALTGAAASAVLTGVYDLADVGWVRIEREWIQYAGVQPGSSTTTLQNLVRGQYNTTAASHDVGLPAYWGVPAPRAELYNVLFEQAIIHLHEMFLTDGAPKEQDLHQKMISYHQGNVAKFWRNWSSRRKPALIYENRERWRI